MSKFYYIIEWRGQNFRVKFGPQLKELLYIFGIFKHHRKLLCTLFLEVKALVTCVGLRRPVECTAIKRHHRGLGPGKASSANPPTWQPVSAESLSESV